MFGDPKMRATAVLIRCKLVGCTVLVLSSLTTSLALPAEVSPPNF